jgi:hypothetical protein
MISMGDRTVPETFLTERIEEVLALHGEDILDRVGTGHVSPAAYDTGFVARVSDMEGTPEFPQTLDWLVANQRDDGSWGSEAFHAYDRFINTLSGIALKERDHSPESVAMAEAYLSEAIHKLKDHEEGVSSDHLVAMLMAEARRVDLKVPHEHNPHKGSNPLKKAVLSYRYVDKEHPLAFFVELLGRMPSQSRITKKLQMDNGSIASSSASTAASIVFDHLPRRDHSHYHKLRFIKETMNPDGGVKHFWDQDIWDRIYGLYCFLHTRSTERAFRDSAKVLADQWRGGLSFGSNFAVIDLDDTAMGYRILTSIGQEPDPHVLDDYWKGTFWATYKVHDKGHAAPNIHALEAMAVSSHPDKDADIDATIKWLKKQMVDGNHFVDHWHLSPAYPTTHAIFAFHLTEETLMDRCVSFYLDTQYDDGSWGFISNGNGLGTLEETALVLQGLLYYNNHVERLDTEPLRKGMEYILDAYPSADYPAMWWAKVLYTPKNMIDATVISAMMMYRQVAGAVSEGISLRGKGGG